MGQCEGILQMIIDWLKRNIIILNERKVRQFFWKWVICIRYLCPVYLPEEGTYLLWHIDKQSKETFEQNCLAVSVDFGLVYGNLTKAKKNFPNFKSECHLLNLKLTIIFRPIYVILSMSIWLVSTNDNFRKNWPIGFKFRTV